MTTKSKKYFNLIRLLMQSIKIITLIIGLTSFVFSTLSLSIILIERGLYNAEWKVLVICIWLVVSLFLCLWGANRQSIINYLRLIGFPLAMLIAMQFSNSSKGSIFVVGLVFIVSILLWNITLSVWVWIRN